MFGKSSCSAAIAAIISLAFASYVQAGVGKLAGGALSSLDGRSLIEKTQYYSFGNNNFCWYDDGWQGPGWYLCGDEWDNGFGWGGPFGWNGWGGGYTIRRHGSHGVGVWHPGAPSPVFGGGAPSSGLGAGGASASPGFQGGGVSAFHGFGGGGGGFHRPGPSDALASHGFQSGGVPGFHGFGGGEGPHGFGGPGGFHGGGGTFSFGGHGGGGHR